MKKKFSSLDQPALMISFADDQLAPEKAVKELIQRYQQINGASGIFILMTCCRI